MWRHDINSLLIPLFISLLVTSTAAMSRSSQPALDDFVADELLVKFKPGTAATERAQAHRAANAIVARQLASSDVLLMKVPAGTVDRQLAVYRNNPNIEIAEKNYRRIVYLPATNEGIENPTTGLTFENFNEQWNLNNTGQEFGLTRNAIGNLLYPSYEGAPDADIDAPEAWGLTHGSSAVTIAVLDTGVACDHKDLEGKCVEIASFVGSKSSTVEDTMGHGTHVAGIAAASTDNGVGIAGVGWNSSIAALKTCWEDNSLALIGIITGVCDDSDVIDAINHASTQGYRVVSMSFAGSEPNALLEAAVDAAWANGVVLIAASGNIYTDDILYPAGYTNVISVGATDHQDNLSAFSNHGVAASLLAPGTHIVSTMPGESCGQAPDVQSDCYDTKSGTSMAAPHVAGLAALIAAHYPSASNSDIRAALEDTADTTGALGQNMLAWSTYGRINMYAALANDPTSNQEPSVELQAPPLVGTANAGKGNKYATASVTVIDHLGNPVSNAAVTGSFTGSYNESFIETTDGSGVAQFQTSTSVKGALSFTFCVTTITSISASNNTINSCSTF